MNLCRLFRLLFILLLCHGRGIAQGLPEASPNHPFWDRENKVLLTAHAGITTADFVITHQNLNNGGHEMNPLAKPLCESGTPGQVVFFGGRVLSTLSVSYALHRTGHHKLERGVTLFMIGDSAYGVSYSLAHR